MRFISTRGGEKVTAAEAVTRVISASGGLFVPEKFPVLTSAELECMLSEDFTTRTVRILKKFFIECDEKELCNALNEAYEEFDGDDPAPLVRVDEGVYMLELFHGPTCSAKDIIVSAILPILNKYADGKVNIAAATSGDLGKAALEKFKNFPVQVFYPAEGLSKMQKVQLLTDAGKNKHVVGVKGDFNDCLDGIERGDAVIVNSVNFAAIAARIAYFFSAYTDLLSSEQIVAGEEIDVFIPLGNMGNVMGAYYAKVMGLPIRRIHCAANENNAAVKFFTEGIFKRPNAPIRTTSPSMDICFPPEMERLIFEISGRDYKLTAKRMSEPQEIVLTEEEKQALREVFDCGSADEETCVEAMYDVFIDAGYTMDTCTGCAMKVAQDWYEKNKKDETKAIIVAINSPYKFPQDVLYAVTGNDVKDSFKGVKRLHDATAMTVPKSIKELRDKSIVYNDVIDKDDIPQTMSAFFPKK